MTHPSAKARLLEGLRSTEADAILKLSGLRAEDLETGAYEGGWNRRQVLAHIASVEWTYARLISLASGEPPAAPPSGPRPAGAAYKPPSAGMAGGVNDYNQRQVDKLADASVPELLALFQKNRAATIAAVEAADEALFEKPVRSAGGLSGTLAQVMEGVAVLHVRGHVNDILGASA